MRALDLKRALRQGAVGIRDTELPGSRPARGSTLIAFCHRYYLQERQSVARSSPPTSQRLLDTSPSRLLGAIRATRVCALGGQLVDERAIGFFYPMAAPPEPTVSALLVCDTLNAFGGRCASASVYMRSSVTHRQERMWTTPPYRGVATRGTPFVNVGVTRATTEY